MLNSETASSLLYTLSPILHAGDRKKVDSTLRAIPIMILCVIGILSLFSVKGSDTFQITTDSSNQYNPAIYENIVVWEDDRNGNTDIHGYNLSTQEEVPICTDPSDQSTPAIYSDIVIWVHESEGKTDIYGRNISSGIIPVSLNYKNKVILLCFFCGILAAFPTVLSVVIRSYVKHTIPERMVTFETPKDTRRSSISLLLYILAVLSFLCGLQYIINDLDGVMRMDARASVIFGTFLVILSGLFVCLAFWSRPPFIHITREK
ncbi:MAG: hypothetical protein HXS44_07310 [Theionarchaea archaeon]|nr:hypothetical protein [Theionarchaea archaeon]